MRGLSGWCGASGRPRRPDHGENERDQRDHAEHDEHAAPVDEVGDHAGGRRAQQIAGDGAGQQPPDRDLPLRQRHQIGQHRHAERKQPAAAGAGDDAQQNNCGNVVAKAHRNDATVSTTRQPIITRFLPTESATGPSTGSTMP